MPSRQTCLSSGETPRPFARHRRKNPVPRSSGRSSALTRRSSSSTLVCVDRADLQSPWFTRIRSLLGPLLPPIQLLPRYPELLCQSLHVVACLHPLQRL